MKLRPIEDRVIIKPETPPERTKCGLTIATMVDRETTYRGKIVAHGSGVRLKDGTVRSLDVSIGETVVFEKTVGIEINQDGEKYVVVREPDILFVLE